MLNIQTFEELLQLIQTNQLPEYTVLCAQLGYTDKIYYNKILNSLKKLNTENITTIILTEKFNF
jgi:hypothetical protein